MLYASRERVVRRIDSHISTRQEHFMTRSFTKWVSIVPVLVCFPMVLMTAGYGMAQAPAPGTGNVPGYTLYGAKVATSKPEYQKLITKPIGTVIPAQKSTADKPENKTTVQSGPQGKQPPVPVQVKPHMGKRTFNPVVHVPPEDMEKTRKLLEKISPGKKNGQ